MAILIILQHKENYLIKRLKEKSNITGCQNIFLIYIDISMKSTIGQQLRGFNNRSGEFYLVIFIIYFFSQNHQQRSFVLTRLIKESGKIILISLISNSTKRLLNDVVRYCVGILFRVLLLVHKVGIHCTSTFYEQEVFNLSQALKLSLMPLKMVAFHQITLATVISC